MEEDKHYVSDMLRSASLQLGEQFALAGLLRLVSAIQFHVQRSMHAHTLSTISSARISKTVTGMISRFISR